MSSNIAAFLPVLSQSDLIDAETGESLVAEFEPLAPEPEPELTVEEQIAEAYQRGRLDAGEELKAAFEAERDRLKSAASAELETLRLSLEDELAAKVAADLEMVFAALEQRVSGSVARCLDPLLDEAVTRHLVDGFKDAIRQAWGGGEGGSSVKVCGPQALLDKLSARLGPNANRIQLEAGSETELTAVLDDTAITTRLSEWQTQLNSVRETL